MYKRLWILIGPSGSGKSSTSRILKDYNNTVVYSWDALRHEWYDKNDYNKAFELACADKQFKSKAMNEYYSLIDDGKSVVVDNVNLTPKSRKKFVQYAKARGYHTIGVLFNVELQTLIDRQLTRTDKTISEGVVRTQYESLKPPIDNEFDQIINSTNII